MFECNHVSHVAREAMQPASHISKYPELTMKSISNAWNRRGLKMGAATTMLMVCLLSNLVRAQDQSVNGNLTVTGKVGVGTTNPSNALDVRSTGTSTVIGILTGSQAADAFRLIDSDGSLRISNGVTANLINLIGSKVGINTATPANALDVKSSGTSTTIGLLTGSKAADAFRLIDADGSLRLSNGITANLMSLTGSSVGVGTNSPSAKLHVVGNAGLFGDFVNYSGTTSAGVIWPNGKIPELLLERSNSNSVMSPPNNTYRAGIGLGQGVGIYSVNPNPSTSLYFGDIRFHTTWWDGSAFRNSDRMVITQTGLVGIGTAAPDKLLTVKGSIHATEVVVDNSVAAADIKVRPAAWADCVFDDNYRNAPLSEVEQHIKAHKHLPGIPSAEKVGAEGISVAQMQTLLLQKVEELTLHLIRIEKENAALRGEVDTLKQANASVANR